MSELLIELANERHINKVQGQNELRRFINDNIILHLEKLIEYYDP